MIKRTQVLNLCTDGHLPCTTAHQKKYILHKSNRNPLNTNQISRSCRRHRRSTTSTPLCMSTAAMPPPLPDVNPSAINAPSPPTVVPEGFVLPSGRLSPVNRTSSPSPADIFHCAGCTEPACQGAFGCAATPWRLQPGGYLREILTAKVYDVAIETPLQYAQNLSNATGNKIYFKREDLQPVKSFKLRGAYNKMAQLTPEQLERGVICSSAGNHAQGVALAAAKLGCTAIICMPLTTPDIKVAAVRALGGTVELVGESYQETQEYAQAKSARDGRVFIAPYDDPYTIAGQGTIAAEILRQLNMDEIDAVLVAVGGGGMIAGIAAYIKSLKPDIKVIGVEPSGANAMAQSLALGERVQLSRVDAFADGVAVKMVGAETFRMCKELLDGVVLVDNAAISTAIKDVFNETRSILEPSGAVAVAGAKSYLKQYGLKDRTVVAITSGANMNFERLRQVADLADTGESETLLAVSFAEEKGAFLKFIDAALTDAATPKTLDNPTMDRKSSSKISITELKYRFSLGRKAAALLGVDIAPGSQECNDLIQRLQSTGHEAIDISTVEMAQVHLRHLIGGHSAIIATPSSTGTGSSSDLNTSSCMTTDDGSEDYSDIGLTYERIFQVEFPERPGALRAFLPTLSPRWAITLFHYRRSGNRTSAVLIGIEVQGKDGEEFAKAVKKLEKEDYAFTEIGAKEQDVFRMFLQ